MISEMKCSKQDSLIFVLKKINDNAKGVVFITDENNKLCGVVTDGDIRRALLNDISLDTKVSEILPNKFVYGKSDDSYDTLMKMISTKIKIIPLVNQDFEVVNFFEFNQNVYFPVAIPNLTGNEFKYLTDAFMSTWISSTGEYIQRFEKGFSEYSDCQHGVAVSNGTVALHLALVTLGIGAGDEVIVPDLTFAATINTVIHANATPVIVDVDADSWCIDPVEIEKAITPNTKAIIPVHVYGQPCDMDAIMKIAEKHQLFVIEDCAEAHGATFNGKKVGSFGDIGCFSFYGNKVITTGEGGMCVTNNTSLDEKMKVLRDHGMSKTKRYWHDMVGYNYRMTNLQAAIGLAQLERIDEIHSNRRKYETIYRQLLDNKKFSFQQNLQNRGRITWLVCVLAKDAATKSEYLEQLRQEGIDARSFFFPLSAMDIYKPYAQRPTPVSHALSNRGFNLPTYENLKSLGEIERLFKEEINV